MPLIEVSALRPARGAVDPAGVVRAVALEAADALGARPEAVWVTWRWLEDAYAVGEDVAAAQPRATHAPIVHVYVNRPPDAVERLVDAVERVLCRELGLEEGNVFVTVQPVHAAPG